MTSRPRAICSLLWRGWSLRVKIQDGRERDEIDWNPQVGVGAAPRWKGRAPAPLPLACPPCPSTSSSHVQHVPIRYVPGTWHLAQLPIWHGPWPNERQIDGQPAQPVSKLHNPPLPGACSLPFSPCLTRHGKLQGRVALRCIPWQQQQQHQHHHHHRLCPPFREAAVYPLGDY